MKVKFLFYLVIFFLAIFPITVLADNVTIKNPNNETLEDTYIAKRNASTNYYGTFNLLTGNGTYSSSYGSFATMIKFNLSLIPVGKDIDYVDLCLFIASGGNLYE